MFNRNEFDFVKVAAVSPEIRIANVEFNVEQIIEALTELEKLGAEIIVFPELTLTSYSCGDLFYNFELQQAALKGLGKLVSFSKGKNLCFIVGNILPYRNKIFNAAFVIHNGRVLGIVPKSYLPSTNEFYEQRWFSSGISTDFAEISLFGETIPFGTDLIFFSNAWKNLAFSVEICQDLWDIEPPSNRYALGGAFIVFNLSASDEHIGKADYRRSLVANQSAKLNCAYVYCGSGVWESTADLVFSGHCIIAENGKILNETSRFSFKTEYVINDIDLELLANERQKNISFMQSSEGNLRYIPFALKKSRVNKFFRLLDKHPFLPKDERKRGEVFREIFNIQTTGLARRLAYLGIRDVVIGVSGGLDSTLALLVSIDAFEKLNLDKKGIHPVIMPGFGTSSLTKNNAIELVKLLNLDYQLIEINEIVKMHFKQIGFSGDPNSVVFENAQARERTQILMDLANKCNGIVVGTGDLSEIALGWSTFNADHMSMYNPNAGVPKTLVRFLVEWAASEVSNSHIAKKLIDIVNTPITPELLPPNEKGEIVQKTEDIVGPFELNDFFLYYFVRYGFSPKKILFLASIAFKDEYSVEEIKKWLANFSKRFVQAQYKRNSMPDGPKVGTVALSPRGDWRMPSDCDWEFLSKGLE